MSSTSQKHGSLFTIYDIIFLILGVLCASFALKSFLVPNHFLDGGVTGISLLLHEVYGWNLGLLLILLNIPFILLSWAKVGRNFAIRSSLTIILIALAMHFISFPELTHDRLLVAMFGGFFMGIGIGLSMRGGGTFDGMEVLALLTFKRSSFTITEIILGMNMIIFIIAAAFIRVETALYAILTYLIASQTTKYVIEGIEAYTGVTIVSSDSEAVKRALVLSLNRGITVYKGERGFMKESFERSTDVDIIFTIVTRLEVRKLRNIVHAIDPKAFIFTQTVREPQGGIVKEIVKH
ncbi:YitT family protein [Sphingobacterium corticis]|uniref:YitT family protein n=1 Tax=Sphingobacterium corticis TaxID=1812823 RepID=A0ABW5NJ32_9SPHI